MNSPLRLHAVLFAAVRPGVFALLSLCVVCFVFLQGSANEYSFDAVFPPEAGQSEVYEGTAKPHISELLEGINVTVFAYGATGESPVCEIGVVFSRVYHVIHDMISGFGSSASHDTSREYYVKACAFRLYMIAFHTTLFLYMVGCQRLLTFSLSRSLGLWLDYGSAISGTYIFTAKILTGGCPSVSISSKRHPVNRVGRGWWSTRDRGLSLRPS